MSIAVIDPLTGNKYANLKALAYAYGLTYSTLYRRVYKLKWSLEDALKMPGKRGMTCVDHLGKQYPSFKAMAEAYGLNPITLSCRMDRWELKDALETPIRISKRRTFKKE